MKRINAVVFTMIMIVSNLIGPFALANSGPTYWEGSPGAELLSIDGSTPIEVLHEKLVFDFMNIEDVSYTVSGWMTAEYEMHNTSELEVTAMMTFPMLSYNQVDSDDIVITVDGVEVPYELYPHTIFDDDDRDFSKIVGDIQSDYRKDTIFNGSTQGTLWTFGLTQAHEDYEALAIDIIFDPSETQIISSHFNSGHYEYGHAILSADLRGDDEAMIYYRGQKPTLNIINTVTTDFMEAEMSFLDYYETYVIPDINQFFVSEDGKALAGQYNQVSLFNMITERLQTYIYNQSGIVEEDSIISMLQGDQIVSANYEVVFEPNQTRTVMVSYKVKASMKTKAYRGRDEATYTFEYLLNPAKSWKDFGVLDIEILVDDSVWEIVESNLTLDKGEQGYVQTNDGLLEDDIFLTLRKVGDENSVTPLVDGNVLNELGLFLGIMALFIVTLLGIGYLLLRRKKL